jgi:NhaA family Na+:H+ antiporter
LYQARQLIHVLQEYSIPLVMGVVAGLAVANIDHHFYEKLVDYRIFGFGTEVFGRPVTVHFLINEVFMVFFFGIAAKEITESVIPGGALNPIPRAINPLMGTLGGVLGPAGLYLLLTWVFYGGTDDFSVVANGWGIPAATDIALAWLVARLAFGNGHPAVNFLLLLAVADDAIGLGIIAVFYPDPVNPVQPAWLLLTVAGMVTAYGFRRSKVNDWPAYIFIAGGLSWAGLAKSSIEPALALVVIVPFLPGPQRDPVPALEKAHPVSAPRRHGAGANPATHRPNALEQFEHQLKLFVDLGLFFFAFANAGVAFGSINAVTFIVLASLIAGKTIGVSCFSWAAVKLGFPLPAGMGMRHLAVAGLVAGLGLTVALFVAGKAFTGPPFQDPAKMGAVLSASVALLALVAAAVLKVKDGAGGKAKRP